MQDNLSPPATSTPPKFRVKFADGPAAGILAEYDKEQTVIRYGMWDYESAGRRDGDHWLFVKRPLARVGQRVIAMLRDMHNQDPRLVPKPQPNKVIKRGRNDPCWCGSGRKYKKCHALPQSN